MDGSRFDELARTLATAGNRRHFVGGLIGGVGMALGVPGARAVAACPAE